MRILLFTLLLMFLNSTPALAVDGMIDVESDYTVKETADRLENILTEKGMTIFERVRHSEGAAQVGIEIPSTELLIFGNPKVGSPLMKCQQSVAIDLPQKALIWADAQGKVRLSYNDPGYLVKRHAIAGCEETIAKIEKALAGMMKAAASK